MRQLRRFEAAFDKSNQRRSRAPGGGRLLLPETPLLHDNCNEVLPARLQQTSFATFPRDDTFGNIGTYCIHTASIASASVNRNEGIDYEATIYRRNFADDSYRRHCCFGSRRRAGHDAGRTESCRRGSGPAHAWPHAAGRLALARPPSRRANDGFWRRQAHAPLRTARRLPSQAESRNGTRWQAVSHGNTDRHSQRPA